MKIVEHNPFATPIYEIDISKDMSNIVKDVHEIRNRFPDGNSVSNMGGWQSIPMVTDMISDLTSVCEAISIIEDAAKRILSVWGIDKSVLASFWFNVNGHDNFNLRHSHIGSNSAPILSGCLYISVPKDSGDIVFVRPGIQLSLPQEINNRYVSELFGYSPVDGKAVIFPSSLEHYVEPNKSNNERISMAFNIK